MFSSSTGVEGLLLASILSTVLRTALSADEGDEYACNDGFRKDWYTFCDGSPDCMDDSDENTTGPGFMCLTASQRRCVLPEELIGDGIMHCEDRADECNIKSGPSFCNGYEECNGGIDECFCGREKDFYVNEKCFRCLDNSRQIHNSNLCDGTIHCNDLSDECLCRDWGNLPICKLVNWEYGGNELSCPENSSTILKISTLRICDGKKDCPGGIDEKHCEYFQRELQERRFLENRTEVEENFKCEIGNARTSVSTSRKCDSIPTCELLDDECACENPPPFCQFVQQGRHDRGFICDNSSLQVSGVSVCNGVPDCADEKDELFCPNSTRFYCTNASSSMNVPADKRCDLKWDCPDSSDELDCSVECTNCLHCKHAHFYCPGENNKFIDCRKKVCNGPEDCAGGEDECQNCTVGIFSDDRRMIASTPTLPFLWIISLAAVVGNILVILNTIWKMCTEKAHSSLELAQHQLILNLASADLLVGIYTLVVSIQNVNLSSGGYCRRDHEWRSSIACSFLGVILMIGCEASVFFLAVITAYRLTTVLRPFARTPRRRVLVASAASWILAITLAVVPLAPTAENYFVESKWFGGTPILDNVKREELEVYTTRLSAMKGFNKSSVESNGGIGSWKLLEALVVQLNPDYVVKRQFGYYSAHGVCLPKFFPIPEKDAAWGFSFFIVLLNFLLFLFICVSYVFIYRHAASCKVTKQKQAKRLANLQQKITRMVISDFACWVPICVVAFLRVAGVAISDGVYVPVGTILIPINSMLNPFLYSKMPEWIWKKLLPVRTKVSSLCISVKKRSVGVTISTTEPDSSARTGVAMDTREEALTSQSNTHLNAFRPSVEMQTAV